MSANPTSGFVWFFPTMSEGLILLGRSIGTPDSLLEYCGNDDGLRAGLPE